MTRSKRSTGSDINTKRNSRWFRISADKSDIDQLLDFYWGGPERRITSLTLKIIGLNIIALIMLLAGVFYLGQYRNNLIQSKLDIFETEIFLISAALSEGTLQNIDLDSDDTANQKNHKSLEMMTAKLSATLGKRILVFSKEGLLVADSSDLKDKDKMGPVFSLKTEDYQVFESIRTLKKLGNLIAGFAGKQREIPEYSEPSIKRADQYEDARKAMRGSLNASVWLDQDGDILLTAAMPILKEGQMIGTVMLFSDGQDIRSAVEKAWLDVVKIFFVTLMITILMSIYLSGLIARPLRQLAKATEDVRKGKLKHTDIPDMSYRNDEIGELSSMIRDMTNALWDRMDAIESFAADVAHEIKNPLTSLRSAIETAKIVKKKEDMNKLLDVIQHDVVRMDRLITDISQASRIDAELSREVFEKIDLRQLMRDLIDVYKNPLERNINHKLNKDTAEKNDVKIKLFLPEEEDVFVNASKGRLAQVFQNIISNALSFAPAGSKIMITMECRPNRVTVFVEDEGPGIPENKLKSIFDRFYSERPEGEDFGRHSGLGLSICKQIITAHNGLIFAENRKDQNDQIRGARFVVILNRAE